eukprot:gene750-biopygen587
MLHQPADASFAVPPGHSSTNLFIKHIPESVTDELLEQAMRVFGQLESKKVIRDIHTGRSQEKAFARFTTHEEAERAMRHMVQHGLFGVMPRVEWAQQRYDETITDATRQQRKKLFMRNIPNDVTEEQVRHLVEQYGPVEHVTLRDDTQPSRAVTPPCSATPHPSLEPPDRLCGVRERGVRGDRVRQAVPDVPLPELRLDPDNDEAGGDQEGACGAARPPPRGANRGAAGGNRRNGQRPSATCSGASSLTDYRGGALGSDGMPDMDGICTHAHRKQLCSSEFDTASFQSSQSAFYEYNMSSTASVGTQEENFGHRSGPMALGMKRHAASAARRRTSSSRSSLTMGCPTRTSGAPRPADDRVRSIHRCTPKAAANPRRAAYTATTPTPFCRRGSRVSGPSVAAHVPRPRSAFLRLPRFGGVVC